MLPERDIFSYSQVMANPKESRPDRIVNGINYHILHSGGWLYLGTDEGKHYNATQATHMHLLPDWKLHVSVAEESMPLAWDIVADVFMRYGCNTIMKITVEDYGRHVWPENMFGREITIYIYRHKKTMSHTR